LSLWWWRDGLGEEEGKEILSLTFGFAGSGKMNK
jgi:hypothetical protein